MSRTESDTRTAPTARNPREWRLTGGGVATAVALLVLGMGAVLAGAEYLDSKRGDEIVGTLMLAGPFVPLASPVLAVVLHLCLHRVRRRAVYIAGFGVGSAVA